MTTKRTDTELVLLSPAPVPDTDGSRIRGDIEDTNRVSSADSLQLNSYVVS